MSTIKLKSIFPDINPLDYKIHFARKSGNGNQPLDEYLADPKNLDVWKEWNTYSTGKNHYNRPYIFSLICDYHEDDTWLFGGVWKVVGVDRRSKTHPYRIETVHRFDSFVGRLKITYHYNNRATRVKMENHFDQMIVKEILEEPYYESFPGYSNVDYPFKTIQTIINSKNKKWKEALSISGIYLLTDTKNGKRYVGKASGKYGIWQRWSNYISNGHGGDVELKELVEEKGFKYIEDNFWFTILETTTGESENAINNRESYWKDVLMSRIEKYGYNRN